MYLISCRQSKDGKACLLKAVCEVCNASLDTVGTFMQEIIKAIFRQVLYHKINV